MAANPALAAYEDSSLGPQLYNGEALVLRRDHVAAEFDNLRTASGKWKSTGALYLSNLRLVFVAQQRDPESGEHRC